jgi:hypothetical protein
MLGRALSFGIVLVALLTVLPSGARAANLFDLNFFLPGPRYDGYVPPCDAASALDKIQRRFAQKEGTFWMSPLGIVGFEQVRETAYRPGPPNTVPRRYCAGIAQISDGSRRPIYYSIGEDTGMIGANWGVEWCVVGLDRNWAYNPACKMAKP